MSKYAIEVIYSEEDGGYIATAPELPGCSAFGETEEEALRELKVAQGLWLEAARKEGRPIPKPIATRRYSGRFALRMPPELHRRLDLEAKKQRVSLNQLLVHTLSSLPAGKEVHHMKPLKAGGSDGRRTLARKSKKEAA